MTEKIVCLIMGQNAEKTIEMCLKSVKDCDSIIFCDGGSSDKTLDIISKFEHNRLIIDIIKNKFNKENPLMISKQKNFWLTYLKENFEGYWCIYLDSDEVLEDNGLKKIRKLINNKDLYNDVECFDLKMIHLIGSLTEQDGTQQSHQVPRRIFKITKDLFFPGGEHTIIEGMKYGNVGFGSDITLFHLAYCGNLWGIKQRYEEQLQRIQSGMSHKKDFLESWYRHHLFGKYPKFPLNPLELPKTILDYFGIDKDELYHSRYQLETKNAIMVKQWYDYFKPESVLDLGCGRGCYLYFWSWFVSEYGKLGIEISEWAVNNAFTTNIIQGDITNEQFYIRMQDKWNLITAIDVLEHLDDKQLDKTLKNMSEYGKKFLFSIPFEGDPNLLVDNTHKQFHEKQWWIDKIESYGIKIKKTPQDWLFHEQILVGEKEK